MNNRLRAAYARTLTPTLTSLVGGVPVYRLFCDRCGVTTWHEHDGYCLNCQDGVGMRNFAAAVAQESAKR